MDASDIEDDELYPDGASAQQNEPEGASAHWETDSGPTEMREAPKLESAYEDSVRVYTHALPNEILRKIHDNLEESHKQSFRMASKALNRFSIDIENINLNKKFNRLFGENHTIKEQMRSQFMGFLSSNGINPSCKEQLYWFDFIKFLNGGRNISCEGVNLVRYTEGNTIFKISKLLDNIPRLIVKVRLFDRSNVTQFYINGLESREDGPSKITTDRANGNVKQEFYKHAGHFRPPAEGPGSIGFDNGKKSYEEYFINDNRASDGSFPSFVSWHDNGLMQHREYRKEDGNYVDREMVVDERWDVNGYLLYRTQNMLFEGRYWLTRTVFFDKYGSIEKEKYRKLNQFGDYVLHRENHPAFIINDVHHPIVQYWLDGVMQ